MEKNNSNGENNLRKGHFRVCVMRARLRLFHHVLQIVWELHLSCVTWAPGAVTGTGQGVVCLAGSRASFQSEVLNVDAAVYLAQVFSARFILAGSMSTTP